MRKWLIAALTAAAFLPSAALAESCAALLGPPAADDVMIDIATANNRGVVSHATATLQYVPSYRAPFGGATPARWETRPGEGAWQTFSDRFVPRGNGQRFAVTQADVLGASITSAASPTVVLILRSWRNARLTFVGTCSANGIIHGTAGETDILIALGRAPR